jgi:hypothetical protein
MRFCISVFDETTGKWSCAGPSGGTVRPMDIQSMGREGFNGHAENPGVKILTAPAAVSSKQIGIMFCVGAQAVDGKVIKRISFARQA